MGTQSEPTAPAREIQAPEPSTLHEGRRLRALPGGTTAAPVTTRHGDRKPAQRAVLLGRVERGEITVEQACAEAGISRARFYQLRALYKNDGIDGLRPKTRNPRPSRRVPPDTERTIIAYALLHPDKGERAIARALREEALGRAHVSRHGVGQVLRRAGLSRREQRAEASAASAVAQQTPSQEDDSFASLYQRYRNFVFQVCMRRLGDPFKAEDATQETFVRVYTNLSGFDSHKAIVPWIRTIAQNTCVDIYRRTKNVTTKAPDDELWVERATDDEPLRVLMEGERRQQLEQALKLLPARQRRALLLHALEGWTYQDIAAAESISIPAVKSLLFRARTSLRTWCESGVLGITAFFALLRTSFKRRKGYARLHSMSPAMFTGAQLFANAAIAIFATIGLSMSPATGIPLSVSPATEGVSSLAHTTSAGAPGARPALGSVGVLSALRGILKQGQATPDNTQFGSIVASPDYRHDHVIFAAGTARCVRGRCNVLFVSHDGGATWTNLGAKDLRGTKIMLPPGYPTDPRIFAMGSSGLQASRDGGRTFSLLTSLTGGAAISPGFDRNDGRILIGAPGTVMEFWPDEKGLVKPAPVIVAPRLFSSIGFSPNYISDQLLFLGSRNVSTTEGYGATIDRCDGAVCRTFSLASHGVPTVEVSPDFARDHTVLTWTSDALFMSTDGGQNFAQLGLPEAAVQSSSLTSAIVRRAGSDTVVLIGFSGSKTSLQTYRSLDGGVTWLPLTLSLPGFASGVSTITTIPDGPILAAGAVSGIGCSPDGMHWASRCSTRSSA